MSDQQMAAAKQTWLEKYNGATITERAEFGNPLVQRLYRRTFNITARNSHFVSVYGRVELGEEKILKAEGDIQAAMDLVHKEFDKRIAGAVAIIEDSKITNLAKGNQPASFEVSVVNPISMKHLDLMRKADHLLTLIYTLWIKGEIPEKQRTSTELWIKKRLRSIAGVCRDRFITLRRELNVVQGKMPAEAVAGDEEEKALDGELADEGGEGSKPKRVKKPAPAADKDGSGEAGAAGAAETSSTSPA